MIVRPVKLTRRLTANYTFVLEAGRVCYPRKIFYFENTFSMVNKVCQIVKIEDCRTTHIGLWKINSNVVSSNTAVNPVTSHQLILTGYLGQRTIDIIQGSTGKKLSDMINLYQSYTKVNDKLTLACQL